MWSPYSWLAMVRQRLCNKSAPYTIEFIKKAKQRMACTSPLMLRAVSWASVPECVYRGGCPYSKSCGFYSTFPHSTSIKERYDAYAKLSNDGGDSIPSS